MGHMGPMFSYLLCPSAAMWGPGHACLHVFHVFHVQVPPYHSLGTPVHPLPCSSANMGGLGLTLHACCVPALPCGDMACLFPSAARWCTGYTYLHNSCAPVLLSGSWDIPILILSVSWPPCAGLGLACLHTLIPPHISVISPVGTLAQSWCHYMVDWTSLFVRLHSHKSATCQPELTCCIHAMNQQHEKTAHLLCPSAVI